MFCRYSKKVIVSRKLVIALFLYCHVYLRSLRKWLSSSFSFFNKIGLFHRFKIVCVQGILHLCNSFTLFIKFMSLLSRAMRLGQFFLIYQKRLTEFGIGV